MQFFARLLAILKNREVSLGKEWILCAQRAPHLQFSTEPVS